jgi:hypothetical protein
LLPECEIVIGIVPGADLPTVVGIPASDSVEAMIEGVAGVFGGEIAIAELDGLIYPAPYRPLLDTTRLPENSHLLAFEHDNGFVTYLTVTEDFEAYVPLLAEMVDSLAID